MCLFKPNESTTFIAECETCGTTSDPLSSDTLIAIYRLLDSGWTVFETQYRTFCSERCLDEYDIEHIEERLDSE